jgi:hypothetical protein
MKPESRDTKSRRRSILLVVAVLGVSPLSGFASQAAPQTPVLTTAPGAEATAAIQDDRLLLSNNAIKAEWQFNENGVVAKTFTDRLTNRTVPLAPNMFVLTLQDGTVLKSSEMRVTAPPRMEKLTPDPNASQLAARSAAGR